LQFIAKRLLVKKHKKLAKIETYLISSNNYFSFVMAHQQEISTLRDLFNEKMIPENLNFLDIDVQTLQVIITYITSKYMQHHGHHNQRPFEIPDNIEINFFNSCVIIKNNIKIYTLAVPHDIFQEAQQFVQEEVNNDNVLDIQEVQYEVQNISEEHQRAQIHAHIQYQELTMTQAVQEIQQEPGTCSVCLDENIFSEDNAGISFCGHASHLFHQECIRQVIASEHNKCPLCRSSYKPIS